MKLTLMMIGKTDSREIADLMAVFVQRLGHYLPFSLEVVPDLRRTNKLSEEELKEREGEEVLRRLGAGDCLVLFDERGRSLTSRAFADFVQARMNQGLRHLVFLIGGAYGFSPRIYERANYQLSLSEMTFSHQMVRLFAVEQLYRAMTIIHHEPYHHD